MAVRDLRITIAAVDRTGIGVPAFRAEVGQRETRHWIDPTPVYANSARLVGSYHAHKGAGAEWLRPWYQTLGLRDKAYIRTYEARGEWGRTDLVSAYDLGAKLGQGIAMGIMPGMSSYLVDAQRQHAEAQLREEYGRANAEWARSHGDLDDTLIILERIKLRAVLERCRLPSVAACWVAGHLPAWLLPVVLYYRLRKFSND